MSAVTSENYGNTFGEGDDDYVTGLKLLDEELDRIIDGDVESDSYDDAPTLQLMAVGQQEPQANTVNIEKKAVAETSKAQTAKKGKMGVKAAALLSAGGVLAGGMMMIHGQNASAAPITVRFVSAPKPTPNPMSTVRTPKATTHTFESTRTPATINDLSAPVTNARLESVVTPAPTSPQPTTRARLESVKSPVRTTDRHAMKNTLETAKDLKANELETTIIIQDGQTLDSIANTYDTTVQELLAKNLEIHNPDRIFAGNPLIIPGIKGSIIVEPGNTLWGIAKDHNTTVTALLAANPAITKASLILVGEKVMLGYPEPAVTQESVEFTTVVPGDTMSSIAEAKGISLDAEEKENPQIKDDNLIRPGQKIRTNEPAKTLLKTKGAVTVDNSVPINPATQITPPKEKTPVTTPAKAVTPKAASPHVHNPHAPESANPVHARKKEVTKHVTKVIHHHNHKVTHESRAWEHEYSEITKSHNSEVNLIINGLKERAVKADVSISPMAMAGILGNLYAESGLDPNRLQYSAPDSITLIGSLTTEQLNDRNLGIALAQWSSPNTLLQAAAALHENPNRLDTQLNVLFGQILQPDMFNSQSSYLEAISSAKTPQEAAYTTMRDWERPGPRNNLLSRQVFAAAFYDYMVNGTPLPASMPMMSLASLSEAKAITTAEAGVTTPVADTDSALTDCDNPQGDTEILCAAEDNNGIYYEYGGGHESLQQYEANCPDPSNPADNQATGGPSLDGGQSGNPSPCATDCSALVELATARAFNVNIGQGDVAGIEDDSTDWEPVSVSATLQPGDIVVVGTDHVEIVDHFDPITQTLYTFGSHYTGIATGVTTSPLSYWTGAYQYIGPENSSGGTTEAADSNPISPVASNPAVSPATNPGTPAVTTPPITAPAINPGQSLTLEAQFAQAGRQHPYPAMPRVGRMALGSQMGNNQNKNVAVN
jgi:LysM repeat protein